MLGFELAFFKREQLLLTTEPSLQSPSAFTSSSHHNNKKAHPRCERKIISIPTVMDQFPATGQQERDLWAGYTTTTKPTWLCNLNSPLYCPNTHTLSPSTWPAIQYNISSHYRHKQHLLQLKEQGAALPDKLPQTLGTKLQGTSCDPPSPIPALAKQLVPIQSVCLLLWGSSHQWTNRQETYRQVTLPSLTPTGLCNLYEPFCCWNPLISSSSHWPAIHHSITVPLDVPLTPAGRTTVPIGASTTYTRQKISNITKPYCLPTPFEKTSTVYTSWKNRYPIGKSVAHTSLKEEQLL